MSTEKHYSHSLSWSDECATGQGMCDGIIPEDEDYAHEECGCPCHSSWAGDDMPQTVSGVAAWHWRQRVLYGPTN